MIMDACGFPDSEIRFLATGATSEVWAVHAAGQHFALRIAIPNPWEPCYYEAEFAVRELLHRVDGRVARPISTNRDVDAGVDVEWCLDEFIDGASGRGRELPEAACRDLGELLARLHRLPVEGFGLLQNRRDKLAGSADNARAGVLQRLAEPWPIAGKPLEQHPLAAERPDLVPLLAPLEPGLLALVADDRPAAVAHSDLHDGQILLVGDRLRALLDFGDAVAGPVCWDLASFGYFHGWDRTLWVLEAYTRDPVERERLLHEARLFAVVLALHHASRSVTLGQPQRMQGAVRYVSENL